MSATARVCVSSSPRILVLPLAFLRIYLAPSNARAMHPVPCHRAPSEILLRVTGHDSEMK